MPSPSSAWSVPEAGGGLVSASLCRPLASGGRGADWRAAVRWVLQAWPLRLVLLPLFLLLVLPGRSVQAAGPWDGFWETYSVGEGAYMSLRQEGNRVTGAYFPYNGRIEAVVDGPVLRGRWRSPNGEGTLRFSLSPDGRQFAGTIDSGEWWNGRRVNEEDIEAISIDLSSPAQAMRSFLRAGRAFRAGQITGLQAMFSALHFEGDPPFSDKSRQAALLLDVLSLTTFRVFDLAVRQANGAGAQRDGFAYEFKQAGTGESVRFEFREDIFGLWRIQVPDEVLLAAYLDRLLAARGEREIDRAGYVALASPRDAVKAFIAGMDTWSLGGEELVRRTFDLSAVSERLRDWRLPILATFMASNINRIGPLTLEEIPDDPLAANAYVFYEHGAGSIVIAPRTDADGRRYWQFTPASLATARSLHEALRQVPGTFDNVRNPAADSPYFVARSAAHSLSPALTQLAGGIEVWQWIGLLALLMLFPVVLHLAALAMERAIAAGGDRQRRRRLRNRFSIPVRLLGIGGLWLLASTMLGLPDRISGIINTAAWVLVIGGVTWLLYQVIDAITASFQTLTRRTASTADDVVLSLVSGLGKVLLIIGATVAVADVLGLPYETVLAGVGISGLAFAIASRDLIANLFGSAIIASDRPFKRGDYVKVGGIEGTIERVGLRSTRVRPLDDTVVMIPNSAITTDTVINLSRRRKLRLVETIYVDHEASVQSLRQLRERIREFLLGEGMVSNEGIRVGLETITLYAVNIQIACYVTTNNYDEFIYEKHRLLVNVLSVLDVAGIRRAVIRKD